MIKAIQIPYNNAFAKKCEYSSLAGFEHISVNFYEMLGKNEYEWDKAIEDIKNILDKNNLKCIQTHAYYYDLTISSQIVDEPCEFAINQAVKATGLLNSIACVTHARTSLSSAYIISKTIEDNKRVYTQYLETAKKYNTAVAIENLPIFPGIVPIMPFFTSICSDLIDFVDSFKDEAMVVCWDTGHANLMEYKQEVAIKALGSRIKCTHLHNNYTKDDEHNPLDCGSISWEKVMNAFKDIGYNGPFTLETRFAHNSLDLFKGFAVHDYSTLNWIETMI